VSAANVTTAHLRAAAQLLEPVLGADNVGKLNRLATTIEEEARPASPVLSAYTVAVFMVANHLVFVGPGSSRSGTVTDPWSFTVVAIEAREVHNRPGRFEVVEWFADGHTERLGGADNLTSNAQTAVALAAQTAGIEVIR
jgi:hypothetical protein